MRRVVFLFHRDLRIVDNRGLEVAAALARQHGTQVLPLFIFTPQQVTRNPLKSAPSIQFMLDSLEDLESEIAKQDGVLRFAYGSTVDVLKICMAPGDAIVDVRDYTPFAKQRESDIRAFAEKNDIQYECVDDIYLTTPGTVRTGTGRTFQKFTPFWETARRKPVDKPKRIRVPWWKGRVVLGDAATTLSEMRRTLVPRRLTGVRPGGRAEALTILKHIPTPYEKTHDRLDAPTSHLSAHNHFGTVSIREVYWSTDQDAFRRQLYWRDFYGHIMADFETLYGVGPYEFQAPTRWRKGEKEVFDAWSKAETGVPLVDAGMRELLETGFMHNRARLVVASWLVKDKGVHWRWGERFFAKHLVDYDPAQNMMNWIWVASVLPFASAPFRRHDPERSAEKGDPEGVYREQWSGKK
jgi:deoxyribodipyrimidine photo-lyase